MGNRTAQTVFAQLTSALALVVMIAGCSGTPQPRTITLTLIRHAESESNARGIIDTSVPGPGLTPDGLAQAQVLADQLSHNHYDGVYASSMQRAQQTAAPLARALGVQMQILPGLREIGAGWFADKPSSTINSTYLLAPMAWIHGDRTADIPGSINGNEFNDEFRAAVERIYASGHKNPVAISHGVAIMTWTLMNVKNPRDELMVDHPLPNLGRVVLTGNPVMGWKLLNWDGIRSF